MLALGPDRRLGDDNGDRPPTTALRVSTLGPPIPLLLLALIRAVMRSLRAEMLFFNATILECAISRFCSCSSVVCPRAVLEEAAYLADGTDAEGTLKYLSKGRLRLGESMRST